MRTIKVFISSPSDVNQERTIAMTVLNRLNRRYKEYLKIEGVFWKNRPLSAGSHFQDEIEDPSTADIAVVILWSRLGTNLTKEFKGKITNKQPVTGTQWEFEDAMHSYRKTGKPHVLVYKKEKDIVGIVGDEKEYKKKIDDKNRLDEFMRYWFLNDDGTFKAAFHQFEQLREFENRLEIHLEDLIQTYLKNMIGEDRRWLKGSPYRGLNSFELEHEEIFFGRREQIHQLRATFLNLVEKKHPFLLLIGASGCGKSSLLKAGLLPYLLPPDVAKDVAVIKHCIFKPNDNQADLLLSLTDALFTTLKDELTHLEYTPQVLKEILIKNPELSIKPIEQAITKIKEEQNLEKDAKVRVVIIIDQFEEIFTNKSFSKEQKEQFINSINTFVKSGLVWVLASMRSDFIKHTDNFPILKELLSPKDSRYLLSFPSTSQTRELIIKPAKEAGLSFENKNGKSLDEVLLENATKNGTSLPLLEYVLEELYLARDRDNLLTFDSYQKMGKIEGAIGQKAENVYKNLDNNGKKALESLIRMLVTIDQEDSRQKTAKTITYESIKDNKEKVNIVKIMSSKEVRLFVKDTDAKGDVSIRVAHEALFNNWTRAIEIILISQKDIIVRERLEKISSTWKSAEKKDKTSLLLNDGLPLNEAEDLINTRADELSENVLKFVKESQNRAKKKRWQKRSLIAASVIAIFAIYSSTQVAKAQEEKAQDAKVETEKLVEFMLNDLRDELEPIGRSDILQKVQSKVEAYLSKNDEQINNSGLKTLGRKDTNNSKKENLKEVREKLSTLIQESKIKNEQQLEIYQKLTSFKLQQDLVNSSLSMDKDILKMISIEIKRYVSPPDEKAGKIRRLYLQAQFHNNQGDIYDIQGKSLDALDEYQKALDIYNKLIKLEPDNSKWQRELAVEYIRIGRVLDFLDDLSIALGFFQKALEISEKLVKLEPDNSQWQRDLSLIYDDIAGIYRKQGFEEMEYIKALREYRKSLDIRKRFANLEPDNNDWQSLIALSHFQIGSIYDFQGILSVEADGYQKALIEYQKALKIHKKLVELEPDNSMRKVELSVSYSSIGGFYKEQGEWHLALEIYQDSININKELTKIDPSNIYWLGLEASDYINLGLVYEVLGNLPDALTEYKNAQNIYQKLVEISPNNNAYRTSLAESYQFSASIYKALNQPKDALVEYKKLYAVFREQDYSVIKFQSFIYICLSNIGTLYKDFDRFKEAKLHYLDNVKVYKKFNRQSPRNVMWQRGVVLAYYDLYLLNTSKEDPRQGIEYMEEAVSFMQKLQDDGTFNESLLAMFESFKRVLNAK